MRNARGLRVAIAVIFVLAFAAAGQAAVDDEECLACHEDLKDDEGRRVAADLDDFAESVHGDLGFACVDCHIDVAELDGDHADELEPAACDDCHEAGEELAAGGHAELACVECHEGGHVIEYSSDDGSQTAHFQVSGVCASCHEQLEGDKPYQDRIHGRALDRAGLKVAPTCVTCHGAHEVLPASDDESPVHRARVTSKCVTCHQGLLEEHSNSVHAQLDEETGEPRAVCSDCHALHDVESADHPAWRQAVFAECGNCHGEMLETFVDGFHGKATLLGFDRVARCSDCHGSHDIRATDDPQSRVGRANVVETCRECHEDASANWASYDPHADLANAERNPQAYWARKLMVALLTFVFSFFFVHTALWLPRSLAAVRAARGTASPDKGHKP